MDMLDGLLVECVRRNGSDLHLAPDWPACVRVQGELAPIDGGDPIPSASVEGMAAELLRRADRPPLGTSGSADGAVTGATGARFRFNIYRRQGRVAIAIRRLEDRIRPLSELGLPDGLYALCGLRDGLIVVSGPTGSGKSTTLAALIDRVNRTRRSHVVTIEDPIEYLHPSAMSLVNQRQIGSDAASFNEALVAAMRQDPDVILVGEIRDLATIRTAITASETGHLVFTTLHAGDCVGSIERLVSVFSADEQEAVRRQLAMVLRAVISQHLLPGAPPARSARIDLMDDGPPAKPAGRVLTTEILMSTPAVANMIASGKGAQLYSAIEGGQAVGMQTLEQDLARLWAAGRITERVALGMARNPNVLRDRVELLRRRGPAGAGAIGTAPGRAP